MIKNLYLVLGLLVTGTALLGYEAAAQEPSVRVVSVFADGLQETPAAVFTTGKATLQLIDRGDLGIDYHFKFRQLNGNIEDSVGAHIHFGRPGLNGGIMAFICGTTAVPGPPGTPVCVSDGQGNGSISGTLFEANVLPIDNQGFPGQSLDALREVIRQGAAYLNVHTDAYPSGEIRGDFRRKGR